VEEEAEREAGRDNYSRPAVELTEALPQVPQGRRVVRKRKAQEVESSRYWFAALMSCQISVLLYDSIHLYSSRFFTQD
jgi:hypothetical protein